MSAYDGQEPWLKSLYRLPVWVWSEGSAGSWCLAVDPCVAAIVLPGGEFVCCDSLGNTTSQGRLSWSSDELKKAVVGRVVRAGHFGAPKAIVDFDWPSSRPRSARVQDHFA